jgi:hypothetical protein
MTIERIATNRLTLAAANSRPLADRPAAEGLILLETFQGFPRSWRLKELQQAFKQPLA